MKVNRSCCGSLLGAMITVLLSFVWHFFLRHFSTNTLRDLIFTVAFGLWKMRQHPNNMGTCNWAIGQLVRADTLCFVFFFQDEMGFSNCGRFFFWVKFQELWPEYFWFRFSTSSLNGLISMSRWSPGDFSLGARENCKICMEVRVHISLWCW